MSDEMRKDATEEPEVEAHRRLGANAEPTDEIEDENEVEAHMRASAPRLDNMRKD